LNATVLYAASGSNFYFSKDSGTTWSSSPAGNITSPNWISVSPYKAGELYISGNTGIIHSVDYGTTWSVLPGPSYAWRIAVGASEFPWSSPVVYAAATIDGSNDLYRTDDMGATWIRLSDVWNGFGSTSSLIIAADPRIYKRVYVGTNGR
jgi:xyloglucan-specific exo-beta-1,4-glucanase